MLYRIISFFSGIVIAIMSIFGVNITQKGRLLKVEKLEKNISASQQARLDSGKLTGSHIIIEQNGECLLNKTYGTKNAAGDKMNSNEVYRIASMTKPITAVALLIEYEKGNIDIYKNVSDYLPAFSDMYLAKKDAAGNIIKENGLSVRGEKAKNPVKVYQLVSHTSGVGEVSIPSGQRDTFNIQAAAAWLAEQPLDYEPGTSQLYSTGAFDVAAAIIENVSGMEFEEYLKVNIFNKLGMTDTTFEPDEQQWNRVVGMHNRTEDGKAFDQPMVPGCVFGSSPATYHMAGASLVSTAEDYAKFARMLLNGGKADDGTVVMGEKTVELMKTPVVDDKIMPGDQKWGLGVRVITGKSNTLPIGSFGWSGAYGSHFWVDPTNKITAVYMKNSAYDGGAGCQTANELEKDVMKSFSIKAIKEK